MSRAQTTFRRAENSLVNCLYCFGSKSPWRHINWIVNSKHSSKQRTPGQSACLCSFQKIEQPSLHAAARVARSMSTSLVDWHAMWNAIFDDIKRYIRKEQCASILVHLNKNKIGSWPGPIFLRARKMQSGNKTANNSSCGGGLGTWLDNFFFMQILHSITIIHSPSVTPITEEQPVLSVAFVAYLNMCRETGRQEDW